MKICPERMQKDLSEAAQLKGWPIEDAWQKVIKVATILQIPPEEALAFILENAKVMKRLETQANQ
ncbi:MAG TPA: hypothetical protein VJC12_02460 [Candidatus Paceibacterota bacterium]